MRVDTAPEGEDLARENWSKYEQKTQPHLAAFKAKVALAAVRGDKTLAELAQQHDVRPNPITDWKNQLLTKAADVYGGEPRPDEPTVDLKGLHAKIGQSALDSHLLDRLCRHHAELRPLAMQSRP